MEFDIAYSILYVLEEHDVAKKDYTGCGAILLGFADDCPSYSHTILKASQFTVVDF